MTHVDLENTCINEKIPGSVVWHIKKIQLLIQHGKIRRYSQVDLIIYFDKKIHTKNRRIQIFLFVIFHLNRNTQNWKSIFKGMSVTYTSFWFSFAQCNEDSFCKNMYDFKLND